MILLREFRTKKGLTQAELSEKLGVATSTVCMWETGYRTPGAFMLKKISIVLNCSLDELITNQDTNIPNETE